MFAALALAASVAVSPAPHRAVYVGQGFDGCVAPPTGTMRAWLASPYRSMNVYIGGAGLASDCATQPELTKTWVRTVTSNRWSLVPTYVGLQPPCGSPSKPHFSATNATAKGTAAADDAVAIMKSLGMPAGNPAYVDIEPFDVTKARCTQAAVDFVSAWDKEMHAKHYTAGLYAHHTMGLVPLRRRTSPKPDDIWWANWDGNDSTSGDPAVPGQVYAGHRIHQFRGDHFETYSQLKLEIDNDAVHADVVGKVSSPRATAPYIYAASPPYGTTLKERDAPSTQTGAVQQQDANGEPLTITCQAVGETVYGDFVWDLLDDGNYVSDLYTTTTGGLTFTAGIPRCDTTKPTATIAAVPVATIGGSHLFSWTGSDADSGIGSYDVRYRQAKWSGGFGSWHHTNDLTARELRLPLLAGYDLCASVRAVDRSGNVGAWTPAACIARALDDRALTVVTTGAWSRDTGKHFYLGTATTTVSAHARRELRRGGASLDRVGVVATRCPTCGSLDVYVGRHLIGSLSLTASAKHFRSLLMLPQFSQRSGAVRLVTTSKSKKVQIDGLVISRT